MKNLFNKIKSGLVRFRAAAVVAIVTVVSSPLAQAQTAPAGDVTTIVTSAGGLLTSIYPIVLGAVSFGILISLVKMVRRK